MADTVSTDQIAQQVEHCWHIQLLKIMNVDFDGMDHLTLYFESLQGNL